MVKNINKNQIKKSSIQKSKSMQTYVEIKIKQKWLKHI